MGGGFDGIQDPSAAITQKQGLSSKNQRAQPHTNQASAKYQNSLSH
jgi:hypothetical protein